MVVAQWVREIASDAVFESLPRQTQVVKTGGDSSTAKRSTIGVDVKGGSKTAPPPLEKV